MPQDITLLAHEIGCRRGGRLLFSGLSFSLRGGEALLVTGPNGAGKTSLLRQIAGILPLDGGRVEAGDAPMPLPELCHYVGHANALKATLSPRENVRFWADFLEGRSGSAEEAMERFGLAPIADLPAGLLSAGQKRRLSLLRLFAAKRPIWLLDEPSVSLDAASVSALEGAIKAHLSQGGIAIVASHIPLKLRFSQRLELGQKAAA
jgi:heme exporter protein A